jgi:hypothetical protein
MRSGVQVKGRLGQAALPGKAQRFTSATLALSAHVLCTQPGRLDH